MIVNNPLTELKIQIPPLTQMDIYTPPPAPCYMTTLDYQIKQTKEILARIETPQYRKDCSLDKAQIREMISFYTAKFRELLIRRHNSRGERVFMVGMS